MQRVGVARTTEKLPPAKDCVWLVDHSNQIGPEKVFAALAVPVAKLPPKGETLKLKHVHLLTVKPGTSWKTDDVADAYRQLALQHGTPRAIVTDGAVELRDGAKGLKSGENKPIMLRDFKHYLANRLKAIVGKDPQFAEFIQVITKVRTAVQQTELAHFTPPRLKNKARFMNLGPLLRWSRMMLWQLDHADSIARKNIAPERMEAKFGELRAFADSLNDWSACQEVVNAGVKFINEHCLDRTAASEFRRLASTLATTTASRRLLDEAVAFLRTQAALLKPGERLPMSTELLESSFALYKQLEGQHSQGGFTHLLPTFGALLQATTARSIRRDFARVKVRDVQVWTKTHQPRTLAMERQAAYHEFRKAAKCTTTKRATKKLVET